MTWSLLRRLSISTGGFLLAAFVLPLGLTTTAQGAQVERAGAVAIVVEMLVALGGLYCVAAGLWGRWRPATAQARVRSARILLTWAALISALLCLALPLTAPATMTRVEWISFVTLAAYFVVSVMAIVGIARSPRLTVGVLGLAAAYAGLSLALATRIILASGTDQLSGPAPALSFLLSASVSLSVIAAFVLAWPLRANGDETPGPAQNIATHTKEDARSG